MNKKLVSLVFACGIAVAGAEPYPHARITVDPATAKGPVKLMNAVNGGPIVAPYKGDQKRGNFTEWKALRIPFGRTHDCINCVSGGPHTCDLSAIFPDFDADADKPENYDFVFTDYFLDSMVRAGTQPFFRLGQTIEHGPKKYGVLPPKDYLKWARIAEHVIRHYNEGWGWATDKAHTTVNIPWKNQFKIVYWEIWNEPDLDVSDDPKNLPTAPRCWGGTVTNFFNFYEIAAKHLKGKFPALKIGGPALCGNWDFGERFLRYCHDRKVPLDFFSWHVYAREPQRLPELCRHWRETMDKYGFQQSESILNEWNYVKGWTENWVYSREVESGRFNQKGAAFTASAMIDCQDAPLDLLMYYDARPVGMNGLFDLLTALPMKGYYPFYAWSKLLDCGTEVACSVKEWDATAPAAATGINVDGKDGSFRGGIRAVAAKGKDGRVVVFAARYSEDNNVTDVAKVFVRLPGLEVAKARCHLTDDIRTYTEVPLNAGESPDEAFVFMRPNSFALIEF